MHYPCFYYNARRKLALMNIDTILSALSSKHPFFRSQKEFQEILIKELTLHGFRCTPDKFVNQKDKVDIWAEGPGNNEIIIFEVRNKTKKLSFSYNGTSYELKNHGAQDQGRYDFVKDIEKVEKAVSSRRNIKGYAILISNDPYYWDTPVKHDSVDRDFHINEGRVLRGILKWDSIASSGTTKNREDSIKLNQSYVLSWRNYSSVSNTKYGSFRYLLVQSNMN